MTKIFRKYRLRWLGHVRSYRVEDSRMPKQLQLGELERPQPRDVTKKRLRDLVEKDVQAVKLGRAWYV